MFCHCPFAHICGWVPLHPRERFAQGPGLASPALLPLAPVPASFTVGIPLPPACDPDAPASPAPLPVAGFIAPLPSTWPPPGMPEPVPVFPDAAPAPDDVAAPDVAIVPEPAIVLPEPTNLLLPEGPQPTLASKNRPPKMARRAPLGQCASGEADRFTRFSYRGLPSSSMDTGKKVRVGRTYSATTRMVPGPCDEVRGRGRAPAGSTLA
jgi:hypothetical protein